MLRGETSLKALHGNIPENQVQPLEVFLWLRIPSHLAASPAQPSPQDPPDFSKEGRMILSGPSLLPTSSHFRKLCQEPAWQTSETRCPLIFICASAGCESWNLLFPVPLSDTHLIPGLRKGTGKCSLPALTGLTGWVKVEIREWLQKDTPAGVFGSGYFPAAHFWMVGLFSFRRMWNSSHRTVFQHKQLSSQPASL